MRHYGLAVGLFREGDPADFIVVDNWKNFRGRRTYLDGRLVAADGRSKLPHVRARMVNRFRARPRIAADFAVPAGTGRLNVIEALNGQLITRHRRLRATIVGGAWLPIPRAMF